MPNLSSGIVFSCLIFVTIILLVIITIRTMNNILLSNNKKDYNIAKMNHIIADIISTSAIACLAIIGSLGDKVFYAKLTAEKLRFTLFATGKFYIIDLSI